MKTVARFITRMQGKDDGLFIGSLFKGGEEFFEPNTVYEIREILGTLTIKKVGMGCGAGPNNCATNKLHDRGTIFSWNSDISHAMEEKNSCDF